jgi:hypothetical protein
MRLDTGHVDGDVERAGLRRCRIESQPATDFAEAAVESAQAFVADGEDDLRVVGIDLVSARFGRTKAYPKRIIFSFSIPAGFQPSTASAIIAPALLARRR